MEATWLTRITNDHDVLEPEGVPGPSGVRVGKVAVAGLEEGLWVTYADAPHKLPARTTVPITPGDEGRSVLLVFEAGNLHCPIITGFLQEQPVVAPTLRPTSARIDGRHVHLKAEREIVLECGQSSITLRANGKVIIKGVEVVSRAKRTNKVKGGTVRIN